MAVFRRFGVLTIFLALLGGCSPDYNWRDVAVADGAVQASFPDTTRTQSRKLTFAGREIEFALTVAKVNGVVFAVGYAALPESLRGDESARREMGKEVIQSFYRSANVNEPRVFPDWGEAFKIEGASSKGAITLQARVWVPPHALIEAIVTADASAFPQQQADDFLRSVVVAR